MIAFQGRHPQYHLPVRPNRRRALPSVIHGEVVDERTTASALGCHVRLETIRRTRGSPGLFPVFAMSNGSTQKLASLNVLVLVAWTGNGPKVPTPSGSISRASETLSSAGLAGIFYDRPFFLLILFEQGLPGNAVICQVCRLIR